MLTKLVMPFFSRMVQGGTIVEWMKNEGDAVTYGEDLCLVKVEEVRVTKASKGIALSDEIRMLVDSTPRDPTELNMDEVDTATYNTKRIAGFTMRITSSDVGVIRRIYAREGVHRTVGEILAVLTPGAEDPLGESISVVISASEFRAVTNLIELD